MFWDFSKGSESGQRLRVCGSPRSGVLGLGRQAWAKCPTLLTGEDFLGLQSPEPSGTRGRSSRSTTPGSWRLSLRAGLKDRGGTERAQALALAQELHVGHMPQKASGCSSRQVLGRFQQLAGTRKRSLPPTGRSAKSRRASCLKWASDCQEKGIWDPRMLKIPRGIDSLSVKKWVRADCGAPCAQLHPLLPLTNPLPYTP